MGTRHVEFEELDEAPDPPPGVPTLKKTPAGGDAPASSGQMIVEGKAEARVFLLRGDPP